MNTYRTTEQLVRDLLLTGQHIDKTKMRKISDIGSDCLAQRIKDIRYKTDWDIKHRSVPNKGTLREYWLEPEEIARIKNKAIKEPKHDDEQSSTDSKNIAENEPKQPVNETYEQMGLGLLGTSNYGIH